MSMQCIFRVTEVRGQNITKMHDSVGEFKRQATELNTGGVGELAPYTETLSCVLAGLNFKPCVHGGKTFTAFQHLSESGNRGG